MTTQHPVSIPDLIAFWDFQEEAGYDRVAKGRRPYALKEMSGPVATVSGSVFGERAAFLKHGQWFRLPRADCQELDIHGRHAQVTVVSWLKRNATALTDSCQAIAGIWDETRRKRQYCLFLDLRIWDSGDQVCGHISAVGGPTPGYKYCMDAAIGATAVPFDQWACVAFSYDGTHIRSYFNGKLDRRDNRNPFCYPGGVYDGRAEGGDFTVGAVHRSDEPGNFFNGVIGGLAVYRRALTNEEQRQLAGLTKIARTGTLSTRDLEQV